MQIKFDMFDAFQVYLAVYNFHCICIYPNNAIAKTSQI